MRLLCDLDRSRESSVATCGKMSSVRRHSGTYATDRDVMLWTGLLGQGSQ